MIGELGGNPNIQDLCDQTPLHMCASNMGDVAGKLKCIALLVKHDCWIDALDSRGCTALHYAADSGNLQAVKALVKAGAGWTISTPVRNSFSNDHFLYSTERQSMSTKRMSALVYGKVLSLFEIILTRCARVLLLSKANKLKLKPSDPIGLCMVF